MNEIFATPAAAQGQNVPDYAAEETARLKREHDALEGDVTKMLDEARALPKEVADEAVASNFTRVIKRARDLDNQIEAIRVGEKMPYLRRGDAVDNFFGLLRDKLARRKKTDKPGMIDVLQARLHDYNERRRAEEQRQRDEAARVAREAEEKATRERREQERLQHEAEEKAARARKPENKEAAAEAAAAAEKAARDLRDQEEAARIQRQETEAAARAKPADLVRQHHESGALNTMRQVPYVEIVDSMKLDAVTLWAFVKDDHKLMALKAWAKVTQHKKPMAGAIIEFRNETVVR